MNKFVFVLANLLILCIVRIGKDRQISVLVDRFEGKRLNSPNDLVFTSDGSLYFTDPPYRLLKQDDADGKQQAVIRDLTRPNGIAFSPHHKILYIANSDEKRKVWMQYDVRPDGVKVDTKGNLCCSGPGGLWVFSPDGKHLGTIKPPETPANCNWGDDGTTLSITARTGLYRIKLAAEGEQPLYEPSI